MFRKANFNRSADLQLRAPTIAIELRRIVSRALNIWLRRGFRSEIHDHVSEWLHGQEIEWLRGFPTRKWTLSLKKTNLDLLHAISGLYYQLPRMLSIIDDSINVIANSNKSMNNSLVQTTRHISTLPEHVQKLLLMNASGNHHAICKNVILLPLKAHSCSILQTATWKDVVLIRGLAHVLRRLTQPSKSSAWPSACQDETAFRSPFFAWPEYHYAFIATRVELLWLSMTTTDTADSIKRDNALFHIAPLGCLSNRASACESA